MDQDGQRPQRRHGCCNIDLLYAINSSVVTKKNEKNANLDAFKANVDETMQNDRATQNIAP